MQQQYQSGVVLPSLPPGLKAQPVLQQLNQLAALAAGTEESVTASTAATDATRIAALEPCGRRICTNL